MNRSPRAEHPPWTAVIVACAPRGTVGIGGASPWHGHRRRLCPVQHDRFERVAQWVPDSVLDVFGPDTLRLAQGSDRTGTGKFGVLASRPSSVRIAAPRRCDKAT